MPIKQKKCKACQSTFLPFRPLQVACSSTCAIEIAQKARAKKEANEQRKELREAKERIKSRSEWMKEAQIAINAYRREVTKRLGCISCGTFNGKMNGGHYRSVGSSPATRFVEENIWCQCERCNSYLSGNLINYRTELLRRIGEDKLAWLEGPHEPKKYTISELKEIKATYLKKANELLKK